MHFADADAVEPDHLSVTAGDHLAMAKELAAKVAAIAAGAERANDEIGEKQKDRQSIDDVQQHGLATLPSAIQTARNDSTRPAVADFGSVAIRHFRPSAPTMSGVRPRLAKRRRCGISSGSTLSS